MKAHLEMSQLHGNCLFLRRIVWGVHELQLVRVCNEWNSLMLPEMRGKEENIHIQRQTVRVS